MLEYPIFRPWGVLPESWLAHDAAGGLRGKRALLTESRHGA